MPPRAPHAIIAIDIGTTQSAVAVNGWRADDKSFYITIDRWPGQEQDYQMGRVPTAVVYDAEGELAACGAEVASWTNDRKNGTYVEPIHFKMQLHPSSSTRTFNARTGSGSIPLERIYADYIKYLFSHTCNYLMDIFKFEFTDPVNQVDIVLTHPNKWTDKEQRFLEDAVVRAGLLKRRSIERRLHFVEEAEAAASFGMLAQEPEPLRDLLEEGVKFAVCDAGGSTVDISSYVVTTSTSSQVIVEELSRPTSLHAGGIHVDKNVFGFLLMETGSITENSMEATEASFDGLADFIKQGKRRFASVEDLLQIQVGERAFNNASINVTRGMMSVPGPTAGDFFQPYLGSIEETLRGLIGKHKIQLIILTGGFSESPYLRNYLDTSLRQLDANVRLILINSSTSKAVAIGALQLIAGSAPAIKVIRMQRGWTTRLFDFGTRMKGSFRRTGRAAA